MTQTTSHALEDKYNAEEDAKKIIEHSVKEDAKEKPQKTDLEKLPNPTGWRLLVMPFVVKEKTKGGIIIAQEKQWVIFARYAGSRMEIDGGEIRLLNDDEILGVINNPEDILHAM